MELSRGRRAVSQELKAARRAAILASAAQRFRSVAYDDLSMADVAADAGVAKGTIYLYFATKEALFLALLAEQYAQWFDAFDAELTSATGQPVDGLIDWLVESLAARPLLLQLMGLMHGVLEQNVELDTALEFKRQLAVRAQRTGAALSQALGDADGILGLRVLMWLQAAVIGLSQMAQPAPAVRQAMDQEPLLAAFDIDFGSELRALLRVLVAGLKQSGAN